MSEKDLIAALERIKSIVDTALGARRAAKASRRSKSARAQIYASEPTTLPEHIIKLRDGGFFKEPRSAGEVHAKLQATYHCALDRVVMALLRVKNARKLRKTSKVVGKKKLIAYVW
jgi:hypothetical protein